jgi:hypothetical protein
MKQVWVVARIAVSLCVAVCFAGCSTATDDRTPSGAVRLLLRAVEHLERDPMKMDTVVRLLSPRTQSELAARAELASTLSGRTFRPHDMIPAGRVFLRYAPRTVRPLTERVSGLRATVTVHGSQPHEVATFHLVRVGSAWRVDIPLPAISSSAPTRSSHVTP